MRLLKYFWTQLDQVFSCISSSYKNFRYRLTDGYPEKLSLFEYPNDEISYLVLLAQVTSVQTEICKILVTNCLCLHTCYPTSSSALYKYLAILYWDKWLRCMIKNFSWVSPVTKLHSTSAVESVSGLYQLVLSVEFLISIERTFWGGRMFLYKDKSVCQSCQVLERDLLSSSSSWYGTCCHTWHRWLFFTFCHTG